MRALTLAVLSVLFAPLAEAAPEVKFGDTSRFADFGDSVLDRERNAKELESFLMGLGQRLPAGQQIRFDIKDVNLAGELEWVFGSTQRLRVMRNVTLPNIELSYSLTEGGKVLRQETVQLRELDYLHATPMRWRGEGMGHEKAMLERWFVKTFLRR